jgi:hypothetical protein
MYDWNEGNDRETNGVSTRGGPGVWTRGVDQGGGPGVSTRGVLRMETDQVGPSLTLHEMVLDDVPHDTVLVKVPASPLGAKVLLRR